MRDIRKILVPTDFSDRSLAALRYARELAGAFGAELIVIHVVKEPLYPFALGSTTLPGLEKQFRTGCSHRLTELVEAETEAGVRARPMLRAGQAFVEILDAAAEEQVDLIVIATRGAGPLEHAILGSTTERVMRRARCPVLALP